MLARRRLTTCTINRQQSSASEFLRSQAEDEEKPKPKLISEQKDAPWTGEERIQDAVLRMIIDKYPPMRVQGWEKKVQQPTAREIITTNAKVDEQIAKTPRFPWEFEIKAPQHHIPPPTTRYSAAISKVRRPSNLPPSKKAAFDKATRVTRAKEASFDYSLGDKKTSSQKYQTEENRRPMGEIGSWANLVEDRIERARQEGAFKHNSLRHKPFVRDEAESNPYIDRTDMLMNRMVQRQGAAPAWITLQQDVDSHLDSFRKSLRESWIRRAVRQLGIGGIGLLTPSVIDAVKTYRDREWNRLERGYHEASMKSVNEQLRVYNAIAPYAVRRSPYKLETELEECYKDCVEAIQMQLRDRLKMMTNSNSKDPSVSQGSGRAKKEEAADNETMWSAWKRLVRQIVQG